MSRLFIQNAAASRSRSPRMRHSLRLAQAAISPKITAPVKKFFVQRGSKVKAGQLLAILENSDLDGGGARQ